MTGSLDGRAGKSLLLITTGTVALLSISEKKRKDKSETYFRYKSIIIRKINFANNLNYLFIYLMNDFLYNKNRHFFTIYKQKQNL